MQINAFFDEDTSTVSYVVSDPETKKAALIDPVLDFDMSSGTLETQSVDAILDFARDQNLAIERVLDTHIHADHLSAGDYVRKQTGARYGLGAGITDVQSAFVPLFHILDMESPEALFDDMFVDGDTFSIGNLSANVMHTPGHTPACLTYLIEDAAFVGDTLFMPDYGTARTDFPGGDAATLYQSIQKILSLSDETRIFVGHDYLTNDRHEHRWQSSVAEQKKQNIHLRNDVTEADYVKMREGRDRTLNVPKLLIPSIQVNIRAGALPTPEDDGHSYLKVPLNRL